MHMLDSYGTPAHINWVLEEAVKESLTAILVMLMQETHPLVPDLLSLLYHNYWELQDRIYRLAEYILLLMHYFRRLSLDINTWFIGVEEEVEDIVLPKMTDIFFKLN